MSFHVSARIVERVDVIAAAMFILASVIIRRRVHAGGTLGRPPKCPIARATRKRRQIVVHVAGNSIFSWWQWTLLRVRIVAYFGE